MSVYDTGFQRVKASKVIKKKKDSAPASCAEALANSERNDKGKRGSGVYQLKSGSFYCDMATGGGGWTLVANTAASSRWVPTNPNLQPNRGETTRYPRSWNQRATFYRDYSGVPHDQVMFMSGDGKKWCVLAATDLRKGHNTQAPNVRVIASHGTKVWVRCNSVGRV